MGVQLRLDRNAIELTEPSREVNGMIAAMRFEIDDELMLELRRHRGSQEPFGGSMQREVEEQFDAFLLDPGLGPMRYSTADGRVLVDERTWNGNSVQVEDPEVRFAASSSALERQVLLPCYVCCQSLLDLHPNAPGVLEADGSSGWMTSHLSSASRATGSAGPMKWVNTVLDVAAYTVRLERMVR